MNLYIDAIYENGVLRPLEPLALPDQTPVKLTVETEPEPKPADKLARQKSTLVARWNQLDQIPHHDNKDGWSVRNHDEVLYGKR
jgi:predicted DNA-binding antitoxin AbrB/MazE fold protein